MKRRVFLVGIDRRAFLALATAALAPLSAWAQPAGKLYRVGLLSAGSPSPAPAVALLVDPLRDLGWIEGRNLLIERRYAEGIPDRLPALAAELVRLPVDVIVAVANAEVAAAKQATNSVPIVMVFGVDPVGTGLIKSLARPAGNVTGTAALHGPEYASKLWELLKQAVPKVGRVVILVNPDVPGFARFAAESAAAARRFEVAAESIEVRDWRDSDATFASISAARPEALHVIGDPVVAIHRQQIVAFAARHRLPAIYTDRFFVVAGGLMSYSADFRDVGRRAAVFVDRILKGAKPADLPVEQPTKFELVINLKTAKTLGLTIPPSLLLRADQVIE
jgi:putative ABC transport system substrate-binding protein